MTFLLIASFPDSLLVFRGPLIHALLSRGLTVHVAAPGLLSESAVGKQLESLGATAHDIPLNRTGTNPLLDLKTLFSLWHLMRKVRPIYVMGYTIKPVIYGSLAAWLARVPNRFALVTGLGYSFQGEGGERSILKRLVQRLYRTSLGKIKRVFFQNPDDEALFYELGILSRANPKSVVVNGSGIDIDVFCPIPLPKRLSFLLIARLLGDKGVREYAKAATIVQRQFPNITFGLIGWIDSNPDSVVEEELQHWIDSGVIKYFGRVTDVRPVLSECSVYVLPSYREGTPRTVLEAMAMGRAIITTDAPGCRETVIDGDNGFLVPVRSVEGLVEAMEKFINKPELIEQMGQRSREIAEEKYDVHKVNAIMLEEMGIKC